MMHSLARVIPSRKTGTEPLTLGGHRLAQTVADFWRWSCSDLLDNVQRGVFAEFIVAAALSIPTDNTRDSFASWDLTAPDGVKIEVKSAAYLQTWSQKALSSISFRTPKTLAWDPDTGESSSISARHADVYVFALLEHKDKTTVDPLNLDQWRFYVLPTAVLDDRTRSQHSITLRSLEALTPSIAFSDLRAAVADVVQQTDSPDSISGRPDQATRIISQIQPQNMRIGEGRSQEAGLS